jgi:hypothetical protein
LPNARRLPHKRRKLYPFIPFGHTVLIFVKNYEVFIIILRKLRLENKEKAESMISQCKTKLKKKLEKRLRKW